MIELMTITESAKYAGVSRKTIYNALNKAEINKVLINGKLHIDKSELSARFPLLNINSNLTSPACNCRHLPMQEISKGRIATSQEIAQALVSAWCCRIDAPYPSQVRFMPFVLSAILERAVNGSIDIEQNELSKVLGVSKSLVSMAVSNLEHYGMVVKTKMALAVNPFLWSDSKGKQFKLLMARYESAGGKTLTK